MAGVRQSKPAAKTAKRKASATKKIERTPEFAKYIGRIKASREAADSLVGVGVSGAARASVGILWEMVFDYLCRADDLSPSDFNTLAGVVQKLASARVAQTLEEFPVGKSPNASENRLSAESLSKIEEQLKML